MNNKRTKGENVYQLVQKRLKFLFNEFDNIYVSFSGGKDSGVLLNLCIQYIREHNLDRKIGVYHMDYEAQYQMTTEYVEQTFRENQDILEIYHVCVPFKVVTCASMFQTYWRPWDESMHAHWVRPMPKNCYKKEDFPFYNEEMWDYTFQTSFASWYHKKHDAVRTCCLVGIRTQESLDRWRTIHGNNRLNSYHNLMWTRRLGYDLYNAYPIYDWTTEDIWTAYARFKWPFNQMYELYYKAGVPLDRQRVASPFLSTAQETLKLYKAIDPNTWGRMLGRVNGVNFTGIYGGTRAMHITSLSRIEEDRYVRLDKFTVRSLELIGSMNEGGTSLLDVIDRTISPMGARLLKRWVVFPLKDEKPVNERLDVVEYFFRKPDFKEFIEEKLHLIGDLERIVSKAAVGRISPREVVQLKVALQAIEPIKNACLNADNGSLRRIGEQLNICLSIREKIAKEVKNDPPLLVNKGGVIADGVNAELDELRQIAFSGKD